jgi:hypothetical protein
VRIVIVVSQHRRAFCTACGARWIQEGSVQRAIKRADALRPVPRPAEVV